MNAREINAAIARRFAAPEWATFFEISNSTGFHSSRRADAFSMNIWPSKGWQTHGFEVKVSRADFLNEMKDVTKSDAVGKYCDFWWLVVPNGLVDPKEIPDSWGLMVVQKNGLKIKKQAPRKEKASDFDRGFMASLLRKSRDADNAYIEHQVELGRAVMEEGFKKSLEWKNKRHHEATARNSEWIEKFEISLGIKFENYMCPEDMAARINLAKSLEYGAMQNLLKSCERIVKDIQDMEELNETPSEK